MKPPLPGPFWRGLAWAVVIYAAAAALTATVVWGLGTGVVR